MRHRLLTRLICGGLAWTALIQIAAADETIFNTNRQRSIAVWRKYLRTASEEVLEESYQSTVGELERVPVPSLAVIKSGLDILSLEYPQAKRMGPGQVIDDSVVKRIEKSGFVDALYQK